MKHDELEAEFVKILRQPSSPTSYGDRNVELALAHLGLAVVRLDKTSGFLARVNIGLGVVLAFIGIIQIVLMVRGH